MTACTHSALPDGGVIDRSSPAAMRTWVSLLGVPEAEIMIAVAVVGPFHKAVRRYLLRPATPLHP